MKKYLGLITSFLLVACATSTDHSLTTHHSARRTSQHVDVKHADYCRSVDGVVKVLEDGLSAFCILPGGEVVKLKEFYHNNH